MRWSLLSSLSLVATLGSSAYATAVEASGDGTIDTITPVNTQFTKSWYHGLPVVPTTMVTKVNTPREVEIADQQTMKCKNPGSDQNAKQFVGYCQDGNFLEWSVKDCNKKCECIDGNLKCKHPSDCSTDKETADFCSSKFSCNCKAKKDSKAERSPEIETKPNSKAKLSCSGKDGRDNAGTCSKSILMWNKADCQDNCVCNADGGLYCPPPRGCALKGDLQRPTVYCAGNSNFSCKCKRAAEHELEQPAVAPSTENSAQTTDHTEITDTTQVEA